jgi:trehalose 6-phosphate synthase
MGNDPDYRITLSKNNASTVVKNEFTTMTQGKIITSVSRFDQTKGVDFELDCIESLLRYYPQLQEKFSFLRFSYLSDRKRNTPEYMVIYNSVLDRIKKINDRYGTNTWQPIIGKFDNRLDDIQMTGLFRATDILLIGSLGDGFNHIAVESVMSKTRDDTPIQIVTTDIGATDYLEGYNMIDPTDVTGSAETLYTALESSPRKILSSYRKLRKDASELYAYNWALSIFQASIDISKVPVLSKINK